MRGYTDREIGYLNKRIVRNTISIPAKFGYIRL